MQEIYLLSADYKAVWITAFLFLHPDEIPPWMSSPELLALQHNLTFPESATASPVVRRTHRCRRFSVDLSMKTISCLSAFSFLWWTCIFFLVCYSHFCHAFVIYIFCCVHLPNKRSWECFYSSRYRDSTYVQSFLYEATVYRNQWLYIKFIYTRSMHWTFSLLLFSFPMMSPSSNPLRQIT